MTDAAGFVRDVTAAFGPPSPQARALAWVGDPAAIATTTLGSARASSDPSGTYTTFTALNLALANVTFTAAGGATLAYADSATATGGAPALVLGPTTRGGIVGLERSGVTTNMVPAAAQAFVPIGGSAAGTIVFPATWDRWALYQFFKADTSASGRFAVPASVEIQYFYGAPGAEQTLRYPVFPGVQSGQGPAQGFALNVSLDPFDAFDPARTVFALDLSGFGGQGGPVLPNCTTFAATDGGSLELVPQQGAGIAFGRRPQGKSVETAGAYAYLTPAGKFVAQPTGAAAIRHVMCGLTATEYLLLAPGATVEFVPGGDAYCDVFTPPSGNGGHANPCQPGPGGTLVDPADLLKDTWTTAWVRVDPPAPGPLIDRGYAMQPDAAVYHGTSSDPAYTYPLALGCRISTLQVDSNPPTPLPVAPYGGVWSTGAPPASLPSPSLLRAFESQVIAGARFATAPKDMVNGPTMFDASTHLGVSGGAMTPMGLLAQLNTNPAGTFASLLLARSATDDGTPLLQLTGSPVMAPDVSYALMNANLFMVVADGSKLGQFANEAQLGEWTFQLDADWPAGQNGSDYADAILLFKFTTAFSTVDLVADATRWQEWQTFIDPDPTLAQTKATYLQKQLNAAFCTAQQEGPESIFGDFLAKITDPSWTGILAVNCGLDADKLPIDLQDLLGGISGRLRAHHFGITVNRIKGEKSSDWEMDASSLFAVVHYDADYAPPAQKADFAFQVLKLNVQFENSALVHFDSRIAVTVPQLFKADVALQASPVTGYNVVEIDGVYQRHGDSGTVVFDTKVPLEFAVKTDSTGFRAIAEVHVTDAALVPVSSSTSNGTVTVQSQLAFAGLLVFASDVSGAAKQALDLFSYGDLGASPVTGLQFSAYNLAMTTTIRNDVGQLAPIVPDLSQFLVAPETSTPRAESLLQALPLKVTGFLQQPTTTGQAVKFAGQSSNTFAADYALELQGSLGSLGALASAGLDIDLVLAWQAAKSAAADDQLWLLMIPPKGTLSALSFGIEDVMATTFTEVELVRVTWPATPPPPQSSAYGMYFKNVEVWLLGIPLIPGVSDFTLFANPQQGAASNIGWLMTSTAGIAPS